MNLEILKTLWTDWKTKVQTQIKTNAEWSDLMAGTGDKHLDLREELVFILKSMKNIDNTQSYMEQDPFNRLHPTGHSLLTVQHFGSGVFSLVFINEYEKPF